MEATRTVFNGHRLLNPYYHEEEAQMYCKKVSWLGFYLIFHK